MKKILIFGACGNVGPYLVDYFKTRDEQEYEVIALDISEPSKYFINNNITFKQININDREALKRLEYDNIYAVIDLIGPMPARMKGYHPENYVDTNIVGTFNLMQYCVERNTDRFIYAKSYCDILRRAEEVLELTPDMLPDFDYGDHHAVYSVSQNAAVELAKCFNAYYKLKTFIFRLPTVYLWSEDDMYSVKGVPQKMMYRRIIDQAIAGETIEVWGDPSRKKDMLYVKDLCQMLYKACFVEKEFGYYNAGTGVGTSLIDQIKGIRDVFCGNKKSDIIFCPEKQNAPKYIMNIDLAKADLGYIPKYSYIDMLKDMKKEMELKRF